MVEWVVVLEDWRAKAQSFRENNIKPEGSDEEEISCFLERHALPHYDAVGKQMEDHLSLLLQNSNHHIDKSFKIQLVKQTRSALRFALGSLSIMPCFRAQNEATHRCHWDNQLVRVLCCRHGDAKCRLLAAKVLCNLVTNNSDSAKRLRSKMLLSPSQKDIEAYILGETTSCTNEEQSDKQKSFAREVEDPSWVDAVLMANKAGNREAIGAIVASLYNCLQAISPASEQDDYALAISSDCLLMSTLIRQLLPADSVVKSLANGDTEASLADETTEWITIILINLCRRGFFSQIYQAVGSVSQERTLPEQVAFLHCLQSHLENNRGAKSSRVSFGATQVGVECESRILATHLFLGKVVHELMSSSRNDDDDEFEYALRESAFTLMLEVLSETLSGEDSLTATIRQRLGESTELIPSICQAIANLNDTLSERNRGRKARDLVMTENEQTQLTILVQVLANLVFQCTNNQNIVRTTTVDSSSNPKRCGLHVLLSCTAFSHACFTLREWAIVAIRNVLDGNDANQRLVAELEAQTAVQSAELSEMGVRVDVNQTNGKVSVVPLSQSQQDPEER